MRPTSAVAACAVMVATTFACSADDQTGRPAANDADPSPSVATGITATPAPTASAPVAPNASLPQRSLRVRPEELPRGRPPRVEYIDWTTVVGADGTRTELEKGPPEGNEQTGRTYFTFARFGSGWLLETDSFGSALVVHDFDGSTVPGGAGASVIVASSPDGQRVLLGYPAAVLGPGQDDVLRWHGFQRAAGFLTPNDVVLSAKGATFRGHPDGSADRLPGVGAALATSATRGWVIGYPVGPDKEVSGVFDARTGRQLLRSPDFTLFGTNPPGSLLLATTDPFPDLHHLPDLIIATSSGRGLLRVSGRGLTWATPTWEDAQHLLAVAVRRPNKQYVVRIGVDGRVELAAGPSTGDHYDNTVLPVPQS